MEWDSDRRSTLYDAVALGDERAVGGLLVEYLPQLRAFVRSRLDRELRRRESCSDVVQSVCRELLLRNGDYSFRGETQFRGWLFTSALNLIRQKDRFHHALRRDVAREAEAMTEVARGYASVATPSQAAAVHEQVERLEAAIDDLSDEHREVISLARIAELPLVEVAEHMDRSPDAVRKLLGRALLRLGTRLEAGGQSQGGC